MTFEEFRNSNEILDTLDINDAEKYLRVITDTLKPLKEMFAKNFRITEYNKMAIACVKLKRKLMSASRAAEAFAKNAEIVIK